MRKEQITPGTVMKIETELLDFDRGNPRFVEVGAGPTDASVISTLAQIADLSELVESISANGYIDIEPLIVQQTGDRFKVLEGNRRLAAIRLLKKPGLAAGTGITVPPISPKAAASLARVSVYVLQDPAEARDFIGFKHINGPHKWDALAKARFAADWYKAGVKRGITLEEVARRLGDRHDTVQRLVSGMFVLDQAQEQRVFDRRDRYPGRAFAFSHLYTALTRPGHREFLGLPLEWRGSDPVPDPVPKERLENLRKVMLWLYGSKSDDTPPVIRSQNPNIKELDAVLRSPTARVVMLQRNDLREAYALVESPADRFETALVNAKQSAETALSQIAAYDGRDATLLALSTELLKTAQIINDTMRTMARSRKNGAGPAESA